MQNRVYLRLLLSFIIVASFYTLIIAVSLVRSTYSQQRADAISQIKSNLQQEADISDQQLSAANDTVLSLTEKKAVCKISPKRRQPVITHTRACMTTLWPILTMQISVLNMQLGSFVTPMVA
ncbi:hypothetical protein [Lacticaseibacillus manihotivorans]|uniref:hypothetical protein n=1 Tax=Lacticaseibacillus manihotivorans TaxID=88233 RepID=UPI0006CF7676|nr:hypothetical protein [Lacticaseibacillus manihotivorans]